MVAVLPFLSLLFALHTFLLMGTGTWSDLAMAGEDFGTTLYYVREGVLTTGFLLYAAFAQLKKLRPLSPKASDIASVALFALFAGCVLVIQISGQPIVCVPAVLVVALLVGFEGGMAYECIALSALRRRTEAGPLRGRGGDVSRTLGLVIGGGGALAVVLQYALQIGLPLGGWLTACFVVCFGLVLWFVRGAHSATSESQGMAQGIEGAVSKGPSSMSFICMAVATVCLFALLPFYEVVMRASGSVASFYEWHRLFLAVGYVVIGAVAYLGGRSAASVAIVVAALFAIIVSMQTVMLEASQLTTILFYTLLGAVLAWSAISFMSLVAQSPPILRSLHLRGAFWSGS